MSGGARERGWLVVAHHHPGRLRVRSPRFELDERLLETTQRWLVEHPGVRDACSDATAGSILVAYDPARIDAGELLVTIATRARLVLVERVPREIPAKRVLGLVIPTALGLGSLASFLLSPHVRAPRWDNLLWWGIEAFRALNEDPRPGARPHANGD
jgi:hypothetical protein